MRKDAAGERPDQSLRIITDSAGDRPFLIAEIGGNHEGNYERAVRLTDLAIGSGADCIKYQLYTAEGLVNPLQSPDRYAHFQGFELSIEQYRALASRCLDKGRIFAASVWDRELLDGIDDLLPFYKIGSGDLTAHSLLREFARRGKPMVISTGLATIAEISGALEVIRDENARYGFPGELCLLQCTSMYPIPDGDANIAVMETFRRHFPDAMVGYSDHTLGPEALMIAAARGADVLEFHFTDNPDRLPFRDHQVSLTDLQVAELIRWLDRMGELVGTGAKGPARSELDAGHPESFRRGVYPSRDLKTGHTIISGDLCLLRPCVGIPAELEGSLYGRRLTEDAPAMSALHLGMIE